MRRKQLLLVAFVCMVTTALFITTRRTDDHPINDFLPYAVSDVTTYMDSSRAGPWNRSHPPRRVRTIKIKEIDRKQLIDKLNASIRRPGWSSNLEDPPGIDYITFVSHGGDVKLGFYQGVFAAFANRHGKLFDVEIVRSDAMTKPEQWWLSIKYLGRDPYKN